MILGNSKVRILDISRSRNRLINIKDFISEIDIPKRVISYNNDNWKCDMRETDNIIIADVTGWTNILSIEQFSIKDDTPLYELSNGIIVTGNEKLINYQRDDTKYGLHDHLMYRYKLENASDITSFTGKTGLYKLTECNVSKIGNNISELIGHQKAYVIKTKSGFYTSFGSFKLTLHGGAKDGRYN